MLTIQPFYLSAEVSIYSTYRIIDIIPQNNKIAIYALVDTATELCTLKFKTFHTYQTLPEDINALIFLKTVETYQGLIHCFLEVDNSSVDISC